MKSTEWIEAAAETGSSGFGRIRGTRVVEESQKQNTFTTEGTEGHRGIISPTEKAFTTKDTKVHKGKQHPGSDDASGKQDCPEQHSQGEDPLGYLVDPRSIAEISWEEKRERRIYRGRTINMLRQYMRYSHETGRLPSLLGREFFRAKVTAYIVVTFEDRVIFVHDMETCLGKLDEFSRQLIARHILQEHDQAATARLLGCSERTVRTYVPIALDLLSEILLDLGLLERISPKREKSCQEGGSDENSVSDCVTSKNKF